MTAPPKSAFSTSPSCIVYRFDIQCSLYRIDIPRRRYMQALRRASRRGRRHERQKCSFPARNRNGSGLGRWCLMFCIVFSATSPALAQQDDTSAVCVIREFSSEIKRAFHRRKAGDGTPER